MNRCAATRQDHGPVAYQFTVGFGSILLPLLEEFSQLYPDVLLDVSLSDELSTLGRG